MIRITLGIKFKSTIMTLYSMSFKQKTVLIYVSLNNFILCLL